MEEIHHWAVCIGRALAFLHQRLPPLIHRDLKPSNLLLTLDGRMKGVSCSVCCSMLQCVAVCCSVLQCVGVLCNVLQSCSVCCSVVQCVAVSCNAVQCCAMWCSVVQCGAVLCNVLQCVVSTAAVPNPP